ncbi:MAG: hypothetical protein AB2L11_13165 [Syntrophobacteraceae bacterium]
MSHIEHRLERQIQRLSLRIEKLQRFSKHYSNIRLSVALTGGALIWACFRLIGNWPGCIAIVIVLTAFCMVLHYHGRVRESINQSRIWLELKSTRLARIRLDWDRLPLVPAMPISIEHPFGIDLDITGERSLHRLIDATVSFEGSRRLLSWLMESNPDPDSILKRQSLVKELSSLTLFREKIIVNAQRVCAGSRAKLDVGSFLQWFSKTGSSSYVSNALMPLTILAVSNLLVFVLSAMRIVPQYWCVLFFVYIGILLVLQVEIRKAFQDAMTIETTLNSLHSIFRHLEKYRYPTTPNLAALCGPFLAPNDRPSFLLGRVSRIVSAISIRSHPIIWLIFNGILPWDVYFVRLLKQYKDDLSLLLPAWLDVLAEVEALGSLADYAYLNPDYSYPVLIDSHKCAPSNDNAQDIASIFLSAESIGHPLIPRGERIYNSLCLDVRNKIALITGSNMAGKSTFLRTLGVNLCLAYAGAPVCAASLRTVFFRIFACMRIEDSLTEGFSFFYAEVKRLKMLLSALETDHDLPVIYFLDEMFRGTNNRERFIGSRSFIRALIQHPAVGAIATHDLELVKLSDENQTITNFHFREEIEEKRMIFDYKLRHGPCPTTNALKIMAMVGLPIEPV